MLLNVQQLPEWRLFCESPLELPGLGSLVGLCPGRDKLRGAVALPKGLSGETRQNGFGLLHLQARVVWV